MPTIAHEFVWPDRVVIGTIGLPGARTFYLQVRSRSQIMSVALEKEQSALLAEKIDEILDELMVGDGNPFSVPATTPVELVDNDPLELPLDEQFRAGAMSLGWDPSTVQIVVEAFPVQEIDDAEFDPESIERVKLLAPHQFKRQMRAVRPEDYQEVAERHPEVQRAVASFRWTGSWRTVRVTVDRAGGRPVDDTFQADLIEFLEPYRMAGHDLQVAPPAFVALDLAIVVYVEDGTLASEVEEAVRDLLSASTLHDGSLGLFHPDNLTFGQTIYLSQIVSSVMGVTGVARVDAWEDERVRFQRLEDDKASGVAAGCLRFGPLEIPRLDADPNAPENGRLDLYMEGGL